MTARRTGIALTLFVGLALAVVACSGNAATTPTSGPLSEPPATEAAPSEAPGSFGLPGFSFALPSFTADKDLEAMFPTDIGGQALLVQSMSGADFMAFGGSNNEMGPALQQLGKTPADMSVAFGGTADGSLVIFAFRIKGVDANQFRDVFMSTAGSSEGATITDASLGGKAVKKVVTPDQTVYLYTHGDVIWTVGGTSPSDALLNEAVSKLP